MLHQFLDTVRVFPYSMLWFAFEVEPNVNVKRSMFLFLAGSVALLHSLGLSLLTSFMIVGLLAEISVRVFISTIVLG
jgi:hypothetical protein